ncbi:serine hydrolase domain-containing protein [Nocardioides bruguierae]|uniref:Beta-lactamase family protein n=1 Tax=Nocardioides bruguierae TaxID=2945102 RepID=A0A9X2IEI3_9ACTN|nr:serine hydrolase domain-containing protein [Nocardioides bruguierae]MCM0620078.1 beta-lactamase family protein [Nocardioides bruguierae]
MSAQHEVSDTLEIGSTLKPLTAVLALRALSSNGLSVDTPVCTVLGDSDVKLRSYLGSITFRDVLSHRSGLNADAFVDMGTDGSELQRYVNYVAHNVPILASPGELFSYSTLAYNVLGRAIEVLTGRRFTTLLRDMGFAVGLRESPLPLSALPSGAHALCTPAHFLRTMGTILDDPARIHPELVDPMIRLQQPNPTGAAAWALGAAIYPSGSLVVGHDGATLARFSVFRYDVRRRTGVFGSFAIDAPRQRIKEAIGQVLDVASGASIPDGPSTELGRLPLVGTYENWQYRRTLWWDDTQGTLFCESQPLRDLAVLAGRPSPFASPARLVRDDLLVTRNPVGEDMPLNVVVLGDGRKGLHDGRFMPRVDNTIRGSAAD